jgi:hypothetical protein
MNPAVPDLHEVDVAGQCTVGYEPYNINGLPSCSRSLSQPKT